MEVKPSGIVVVVLMVASSVVCCPPLVYAQGRHLREDGPTKLKEGTGKIRFLYKASEVYLLGATVVDMTTTAQMIGHPTVARRGDGSLLAYYHGTEDGWAGFLGRRNAAGAVLANVALNAGLNLLGRKLYRKGGHWRYLAVMVNVLKGTDNLIAGIRNTRYDVDGQVRAATGYGGTILWSSR
jgi:hypothetical protein